MFSQNVGEQFDGVSVLISVHPEYVEKMIAGVKKVEFRKVGFTSSPEYLLIYSTGPVSKINAIAKVDSIDIGPPSKAWEKFGKVGGISREKFRDYYKGASAAVVIKISEVVRINDMDFSSLGMGSHPPQSFRYVDSRVIEGFLSRKMESFIAIP